MQQNEVRTERQIFQEAFQFLMDHHMPPLGPGKAAMEWWLDTMADLMTVDQKWKHEPLMRGLLLAIYDDLYRKAKDRMKEDGGHVQEQ